MYFQNYKKAYLTQEKIEQFENDIKAGKKVDLTQYNDTEKKNYSNTLSNAGYNLSKGISEIVNKGVIGLFDTVAKLAKE